MPPGAEQAHAARNCSAIRRRSGAERLQADRLHDSTLFRIFVAKECSATSNLFTTFGNIIFFSASSRKRRAFVRCGVSENNLQICNERHKKISYWHRLFQKCYFFLTFRDNFLSFKKNQHHLHHGVFFYVQNQNRHRGLRQSRPRR